MITMDTGNGGISTLLAPPPWNGGAGGAGDHAVMSVRVMVPLARARACGACHYHEGDLFVIMGFMLTRAHGILPRRYCPIRRLAHSFTRISWRLRYQDRAL